MPTMQTLKELVKRVPVAGTVAARVYRVLTRQVEFHDSDQYWNDRYQQGGNSGPGSYNRLAQFKAGVLNDFVKKNAVASVIEFGCGDGNQLRYCRFPRYLGFDISARAIALCQERATETQTFKVVADYDGETADLVLSLDVVYHLVEDQAYEKYMTRLFAAAKRFVVVYSSNYDELVYRVDGSQSHVRHRRFTDWAENSARSFRLVEHIPNEYPFNADDPENTSAADFYVFERQA